MNKRKITIGRAPESDIVIDQFWDTVSNEHAEIEMHDGGLVFNDHSSNGTIINKQTVHNTDVGIYPGDVILLAGKYELTWDVINRFFPKSQRPTVTRNVRAESDAVGRKTVHQDTSSPQSNSSRETEQFAPRQHSFVQKNPSVEAVENGNFGVENTYSQAEIDRETDKWNWGAFFCTWIWAAYHKIYWPLAIIIVACIPYVGQVASMVLSVYLGLTGSAKSWNSGRYSSFESYKSAKKTWTIIGVLVFALAILVEASVVYYLLTLI